MELLADRASEEARKLLDPVLERNGGRASLRGHGEPGDVRRHHGALRGARGPRITPCKPVMPRSECRTPSGADLSPCALVVEAYARDSQATLARLADMATLGDELFEFPPELLLLSSRRSLGDAVEPPALASSSSISPFRRPANTTAQIGEPSTAEQYEELCCWSVSLTFRATGLTTGRGVV